MACAKTRWPIAAARPRSESPAAGVAGEERRALHDDGDPRAPSAQLRTCASMCSRNRELAVADAGRGRPQAAARAPVVFLPQRSSNPR